MLKTKRSKIIAIILCIAIVLSVAVVGIVLLLKPKLVYDTEKGKIALQRVENAQYIPNIDKFTKANTPIQQNNANDTKSNTIATAKANKISSTANTTKEEFQEIIDKYATVYNYAGAGKYLGYDIYEIKEEIAFVVEKVPAFNQWFRMPAMREEEGYIDIPYYESWAYYLEQNEDVLSITRVCWCTRSSYLDFNNQVTVEDHEDGTSFSQYEIMKTNYYKNDDDKEVVESYFYSVGIDNNVNGGVCNTNEEDYYPFEYQYLMNVEDTSLIKYHITSATRYRDDESFDEGGMDIRGLTPYGARREFTLLNYDGYTNIEKTFIDQKFATLDNPEANGAVDFDVNSTNIKMLLSNVGLGENDYSDKTAYEIMDIVAKQIIDNYEIKNNWPTIYKDSVDAIEIDFIEGPHYNKDIPISNVSLYVGARSWDRNEIELDLNADVYDLSVFDLDKEYSLSVALRSRETGELIIIATDYNKLEKTLYNGATGESEDDYYYRFAQSNLELSSTILQVNKVGTYDFTCVLTEKNDNQEDVIMFDTLLVGYLRSYYGLDVPNLIDDNEVEYKYDIEAKGGRLVLKVEEA